LKERIENAKKPIDNSIFIEFIFRSINRSDISYITAFRCP